MADATKAKIPSERKPLTAERLRELLHYDPATGRFSWRDHRAGETAGHICRGYRTLWIDKYPHRGGRLAFLYMTGRFPLYCVDHIDGDPSNDCWSNLREATHAENMRNRKRAKHNQTGLKGVYPDGRGKWRAEIRFDRHRYSLGTFSDPHLGHRAYTEAARRLHGKFARSE